MSEPGGDGNKAAEPAADAPAAPAGANDAAAPSTEVAAPAPDPPSSSTDNGKPEEPKALCIPATPETPPTDGPSPAAVTAAQNVHVRYFGVTDVGRVREHNEDNFLVVNLATRMRGIPSDQTLATDVVEGGVLFAVCDGMGGAAAGEVASQMAVDTVFEWMTRDGPPKDRDDFARRVVGAIEEAGHRIFTAAKADRTRRGMGTTSTVAGLIDKVLFLGQVGDSRAYIQRGGQLQQITKDQSLVTQLIDAGQLTPAEAEQFEHSNIILQALGTTEEVQVDLTFLELRRGDRLLMCSDGLSGLVHADMMNEVLGSDQDLPAICRRLVEMANTGGGHDNVTVICVEFGGEGLELPSPDIKPMYQQYPLPASARSERRTVPTPEEDPSTRDTQGISDLAGRPTESMAPRRSPGFPWWLLGVMLVLLAVAVAVWTTSLRVPEQEVLPSVEPEAEPPPVDLIELIIRTDITDADLFVDGAMAQPLTGAPIHIALVPGEHRLEARRDGAVLANATALVRPEEPGSSVELTLPLGLGELEGTDEEEAAPAPAQEADEEEPQAPVPATKAPREERRERRRTPAIEVALPAEGPPPSGSPAEPAPASTSAPAVVHPPPAAPRSPTTETQGASDLDSPTAPRPTKRVRRPDAGVPDNPF